VYRWTFKEMYTITFIS